MIIEAKLKVAKQKLKMAIKLIEDTEEIINEPTNKKNTRYDSHRRNTGIHRKPHRRY